MIAWIIFSLVAVVITLICISKLMMLLWDIKKMRHQFKSINKNFGSNELVRTNTHHKELSLLTSEINQIIHLFKENERYLEKREKQLKEEITNISHDLRTPLTSIKGFSQLLKNSHLSEEDKLKYIDIIQGKINVLTRQVDLFYELSSIDSSDHKLEMTSLALKKIIEDKMILFYKDFQQRKIDVELEDIKEAYILANEKAIERIIINVIQNALRYARSYFTITLDERNNFVSLRASNDTSEITEDDLASIFNRSYRKDKSRADGQLGLGLHIVQQLIQKQGGKIEAQLEDDIFTLQINFRKRI